MTKKMDTTCDLSSFIPDGFTTQDVVYVWKVPDPVQFVSNLFLPGGFELHSYLDGNCNVKTATGRNNEALFSISINSF